MMDLFQLKKAVVKEPIVIKKESIDEEPKETESRKRKLELDQEEKHGNILTLLGGITAAEDGSVIKTKKKKKVLTEDKKIKLEQEKVFLQFKLCIIFIEVVQNEECSL